MRIAQLPPNLREGERRARKASGTPCRTEPRQPHPIPAARVSGALRGARLDSRAMPQADLPRQRLIRAALELFTSVGYHLTTTPLIAKKAGVAEGTIYRHFDSKQHLLNELYRAAGRWALRVVKEADGLKVGPREKLAELGRGLVAGAAREPAVAQLFFVQRHADLLDDESHKVARDFRLSLESLMAQGKADGSVKPGAVEVWAAVWLGVMSLPMERVAGREWSETHAGVALALDAAWDAVAAPRA